MAACRFDLVPLNSKIRLPDTRTGNAKIRLPTTPYPLPAAPRRATGSTSEQMSLLDFSAEISQVVPNGIG